MKFIEFAELGNPADVLTVKELPSREPDAGEVRVKVLATPIHPSNLLQIAGQYGAAPKLPSVPGSEGIGQVVAVGEGVPHLKPGQNVLLAGIDGTWRDEVTAPAPAFIPVPPGDVEQMSMMAVNPMTAHLLLSSITDLKAGDWIIQSAANSAVGELMIQLAAQRGIKTVNIVRRESLISGLKTLGGDVVLVDGEDLPTRVSEATGGASIALAIDSVGGDTFERMVGALGYGATVVSYGVLSGQAPGLDLKSVIFKDVKVRGFWLSKWYETASQEDKQAAFGALIPMIAGGTLRTKIDSRFPLEEIKDAVARAADGGRDGKVILTPNAE